MDPNQPSQTPVPVPAPAPAPLNQPQPAMVVSPHSHKPLVMAVIGVLVVLGIAGGAALFVTARPQAVSAPTPTPAVSTSDIKNALPAIDSSLKEADVNSATITASLTDAQGDLSE